MNLRQKCKRQKQRIEQLERMTLPVKKIYNYTYDSLNHLRLKRSIIKAKRIKNEDTLNGLAGAVGILFDLPSVKPQPCEDAISRQVACDAIRKYKSIVSEPDAYDKAFDDGIDTAIAEIGHNVPPVTPQPKTGHWTLHNEGYFDESYVCSKCDGDSPFDYKYCPNCGAKMQAESEEV